MLKKTLIATALAGALALPAAAYAQEVAEVYLIPAPLAATDAQRYWKVEADVASAEHLARLATENVYVATPIDDALVDPALALREGLDAYATLGDVDAGESGNS